MSLLMDALKKAELAKRQGPAAGGVAEAPEQAGLALEPLADDSAATGSAAVTPAADSAAGPGNLSPLPSHLEELDAQFLAEAQQAASARLKAQASSAPGGGEPLADQPAGSTPPRTTGTAKPSRTKAEKGAADDRSSAKNVFAAKQTDKPPARKAFALAIGAVTVLAVCAIGGYFWWQLQPQSIVVANRAPLPPPRITPAAPSAPVALAPAPAPAAPTAAAGEQSAAARAAAAYDTGDDAPPTAAKTAAEARRATPAPAAPIPADSPIRVTRAPLKVNPSLTRGFEAFNRGDLALAQIEYERAQKADPRNTDALHGLAAIAARQGRTEQAEWLYRQITEADPQDTVAMAALINSRAQIDPSVAESRLKSLAAAQPELAAPQFSLGNLYARHGRWNDAQQAYFRAYSAEPDNPDILYNLAISLEHLRQNKLAAQYYSQAIAAAQTRPAGFDKAQATARLQTLQP